MEQQLAPTDAYDGLNGVDGASGRHAQLRSTTPGGPVQHDARSTTPAHETTLALAPSGRADLELAVPNGKIIEKLDDRMVVEERVLVSHTHAHKTMLMAQNVNVQPQYTQHNVYNYYAAAAATAEDAENGASRTQQSELDIVSVVKSAQEPLLQVLQYGVSAKLEVQAERLHAQKRELEHRLEIHKRDFDDLNRSCLQAINGTEDRLHENLRQQHEALINALEKELSAIKRSLNNLYGEFDDFVKEVEGHINGIVARQNDEDTRQAAQDLELLKLREMLTSTRTALKEMESAQEDSVRTLKSSVATEMALTSQELRSQVAGLSKECTALKQAVSDSAADLERSVKRTDKALREHVDALSDDVKKTSQLQIDAALRRFEPAALKTDVQLLEQRLNNAIESAEERVKSDAKADAIRKIASTESALEAKIDAVAKRVKATDDEIAAQRAK
jgi:hypothetical protein